MKNKLRKAVIPVAGLGTRMLPATKAIPKELLPIYDKPLIQHVVEEAIAAGISEIILVTRSGKEAIENHFDVNYELEHRLESTGKKKILRTIKNLIPKDIKITSIRQENALGLGHAILCAKHLISNEDFAVLLPDEILEDNYGLKAMQSAWRESGKSQLLVEKVKKKEVSGYGIVDIGRDSFKKNNNIHVKALIEKPDAKDSPSNYRIVGRYILSNSIFDCLENAKPGIDGEIQLTDALQDEINLKPGSFVANLCETNIYDCGSKKGFIGANIALAKKDLTMKKYMKEILTK